MIESATCLLPMITPQSRFLLRLFDHYKSGVLARAGGALEQPNYYLEAMEILAEREGKLKAELAERQARDNMAALGGMNG